MPKRSLGKLRLLNLHDILFFILQVCSDLDLEAQVFCLAVSLLDRFLAKIQLRSSQLQLLGVSCLLVAWKVRYISISLLKQHDVCVYVCL